MPVPDFQTLMLPILKLYAYGKDHFTVEVAEALSKQFWLGPDEIAERLPSGRQTRFRSATAAPAKSQTADIDIFASAPPRHSFVHPSNPEASLFSEFACDRVRRYSSSQP